VWAIRAKQTAAGQLGPAVNPEWSAVSDTIVPLVPWVIAAALVVFVASMLSRSARRYWAAQLQLQRPHAAEFDEQSIRIVEPLSSHENRWEYFPGFAETEHLFVIYLSPLAFHMIPKRAFSDDAERQSFRELLRRNITERVSAFPVLPAITLPPIQPDELAILRRSE
jgi:YcxB-like protein